MAKKKIIIPAEQEEPVEEISTAVALISPQFTTPAVFKLPNVEESLAIITKKRKDNEALVIDGVEDKVGYEAVKAAMAQMKNDRIAFVDAATEHVITPVSSYLAEFKKDLDKIVTEFKAGEKEQRDKKDFIDNEKIRLKAEEEARKVEAMQLRVSDLNALGAVFDGKLYTFQYNEMLMITAVDVKDLSDEKFAAFKSDVQTAYDAELIRIDNAAKLKEQQEKEAQELADQVAEQAAANKVAQDALDAKQRKLRIKELTMNGFQFDEERNLYFIRETLEHVFTIEEIDTLQDEIWDTALADTLFYIQKEKENQVEYDPEPETGPSDPVITNSGYYEDGNGNALVNEVASGNPVEAPHESYVSNEAGDNDSITDMLDEVGYVELKMIFDKSEPFTDFNLTTKLKIRVWPDEYQAEAMTGIGAVGNSGKVQYLNWALISR